jgi:hypothetical protein
VFNVLFVGYSLAKNNLNNTYQYNMISKNIFEDNELLNNINKIQSESFFVPVSVLIITLKCLPTQPKMLRAATEMHTNRVNIYE